jgi:hypothetical protein
MLKETIQEAGLAVEALEVALHKAGIPLPLAVAGVTKASCPEDFWSPALQVRGLGVRRVWPMCDRRLGWAGGSNWKGRKVEAR